MLLRTANFDGQLPVNLSIVYVYQLDWVQRTVLSITIYVCVFTYGVLYKAAERIQPNW